MKAHPLVGRTWAIRTLTGRVLLSGPIVGAAQVHGMWIFGLLFPSGRVLNHGAGTFEVL